MWNRESVTRISRDPTSYDMTHICVITRKFKNFIFYHSSNQQFSSDSSSDSAVSRLLSNFSKFMRDHLSNEKTKIEKKRVEISQLAIVRWNFIQSRGEGSTRLLVLVRLSSCNELNTFLIPVVTNTSMVHMTLPSSLNQTLYRTRRGMLIKMTLDDELFVGIAEHSMMLWMATRTIELQNVCCGVDEVKWELVIRLLVFVAW